MALQAEAPLDWLCLSFPMTLQHADPLQGELLATDPSHGVSLDWGDVQPRAEHQQAAGQVFPGLPERQLGTPHSCKPLSLCSHKVRKGFFFPIPGLARWLQCPWCSRVASGRCLLSRLGWGRGLFAQGVWLGQGT